MYVCVCVFVCSWVQVDWEAHPIPKSVALRQKALVEVRVRVSG